MVDYLVRDLPNIMKSNPHTPQVAHCWLLPVGNVLKLNFEGNSYGNLGQSGMGGTIYDTSGSCIVVFSVPLGNGDALFAELKALLFGLRLIHSRGLSFQYIEVKGDSEVVIRWMVSGSHGSWRLSHLLKEVTFLVSSWNISFKWTPREANVGADKLAKRESQKKTCSWVASKRR